MEMVSWHDGNGLMDSSMHDGDCLPDS
jgi:hypothetical protein